MRKYVYLSFLPIICLLLNMSFYNYSSVKVKETMLAEKYIEIKYIIDILSESVSIYSPETAENRLIFQIEYLDQRYQIYAAVYKLGDHGFERITKRYQESITGEWLEESVYLVDPFKYAGFNIAIENLPYGDYVLRNKPVIDIHPIDNQEHDLLLYFRRLHVDSEEYLIIGGVSVYSLVSQLPKWLSAGHYLTIAMLIILQVGILMMVFMPVRKKVNNG